MVGTESWFSIFGKSAVRCIRVREITLGDFRHRDMVFTESPEQNKIGLGYLSRYVITFDFPRMKIYLKPGKRFDEHDHFDLSGISMRRRDDAVRASSVDQGSAGETAGVRKGDVIEQIDERPAASVPLRGIRKLLSISGRHTLRVVRGETTLDVILNLKEAPSPWATIGEPSRELLPRDTAE